MDTKKRNALVAASDKRFLSQNRELLSSYDITALQSSMTAFIRFHLREEVASIEPSVESYVAILERTFLHLYDRQAVSATAPITNLGEADLERMRRSTKIGIESLPAPTPVVSELSPVQKLEAECRSDWTSLSSEKLRAKRAGNRACRECLDRLLETNDIQTAATAYVAIGA